MQNRIQNHHPSTDSLSSSQLTTGQQTNEPSVAPAGHTLAQVAITDQQTDEPTSRAPEETSDRGKNQPTGLPANVRAGAEQLSGISLDDVHVHYQSPYPDNLDALAYAQGTDIYVGPGQEKHLAHEAWHVVQQKQGQVHSTSQLKGVALNDDQALEQEAETMGRTAAHGSGNRNGDARSLSLASASAQASAAPVQRVAKAKADINQPAANDASAEVPDLTQDMVTKIVGADDATKRQTVLDDLMNELNTKGAVDDPSLTEVVYSDQPNGSRNAETLTTGGGDTDKVRITVYPNAFQGGPAVLYSTLRHELIHVGQRLNAPDEQETALTDDYMQEDLFGDAKDRDADTPRKIEIPLQEIETHCWELLHAQQTGIGLMTSTNYMDSTVNDLAAYTATLIESVEDMSDDAFAYWRSYLLKAVPMLRDVVTAYPKTVSDRYKSYNESIAKAAKDLKDVVDEREGDSKKRKNGSDSDSDSDTGNNKPKSKKRNT